MRLIHFILVLLAPAVCLLASCALTTPPGGTPFGPLVVDYSKNNQRKKIRATGSVATFRSPDANDRTRGYGFSNGFEGGQTLTSSVVLQTERGGLAVPGQFTLDLWNLDMASAHISEVHRIEGLEGYAMHGSDGERGYTVIFYYRGGQCVGRVVSTLFEDVFYALHGERIVLSTRTYKA